MLDFIQHPVWGTGVKRGDERAEVCSRDRRLYYTVCLLYVLQFHGLTTQNPLDVWLVIGSLFCKACPEGMSVSTCEPSGLSRTASSAAAWVLKHASSTRGFLHPTRSYDPDFSEKIAGGACARLSP